MTRTQQTTKGETMEINETRKNGTKGSGFVLSGPIDGDLSRWFERWFPTEGKAQAYADKRQWTVVPK